MCELCVAAAQGSYRPCSLNYSNFINELLRTPAKPATPTTPPSQHSVARDLRQVVEKAPSGKEALSALEGIQNAVSDLEAQAQNRALAEKALKAVAKNARANATARRFVLAYQPRKGGDVKSVEGIEYGEGGKVHVTTDAPYPFGGGEQSMEQLRERARSQYYMAISYVDKVAD